MVHTTIYFCIHSYTLMLSTLHMNIRIHLIIIPMKLVLAVTNCAVLYEKLKPKIKANKHLQPVQISGYMPSVTR